MRLWNTFLLKLVCFCFSCSHLCHPLLRDSCGYGCTGCLIFLSQNRCTYELKCCVYIILTTQPARMSDKFSVISSSSGSSIVLRVPLMYSPNTSPSTPWLSSSCFNHDSKFPSISGPELSREIISLFFSDLIIRNTLQANFFRSLQCMHA